MAKLSSNFKAIYIIIFPDSCFSTNYKSQCLVKNVQVEFKLYLKSFAETEKVLQLYREIINCDAPVKFA